MTDIEESGRTWNVSWVLMYISLPRKWDLLFSKILSSHSNFLGIEKEHWIFRGEKIPFLIYKTCFPSELLIPAGPRGDLPSPPDPPQVSSLLWFSCPAHRSSPSRIRPWLCLASPGCRWACGHCSHWPGWDSAYPELLAGTAVSPLLPR